MRKRPLLTTLLLASLLLGSTGAQAADAPAAPGESAQTAISWTPGTKVTWPATGQLWLSVQLEAGRSVGFAAPGATNINLLTSANRYLNGQCAVTAEVTCTFLPTGSGRHLLRLTGPAEEESTPIMTDGKTKASAYEFGAIKNQRWALPAGGSAFWQVAGPANGSVWAFTVPGANKLTLWDGDKKLQEAEGGSLRFTATEAERITLEVEAPRQGYYAPSLWAEGTNAAASYSWKTDSPVPVKIGTNRTAWIQPDRLPEGRTVLLQVDGAATLTAQTTLGRYLPTPCVRTTSGQQCSLIAPTGERVALRLTGLPGSEVKLSAATGTADLPYRPALGYQRPIQIEPEGEATLAIDLPEAYAKVHLRVPGAAHLSLETDPDGPPIEADGEWLEVTDLAAGPYALTVTAGPTGRLQVQRYLPGEMPQVAIPFGPGAAPFSVEIGARRVTWVQVHLEGGQTYQFQSPSSLSAASPAGQILPVGLRRQGAIYQLSYTPRATGNYLIRLAGAPGSTTLAVYGAAPSSPIQTSQEQPSQLWAQAGSTVWFSLTVPEAGPWGLSVPGAAELSLTYPDEEVEESSSDLLLFEVTEPGTYLLSVKAGRTATYTPTLVPPGGIREMALSLLPAGVTGKISASRSLWVKASSLTPGARYTFKATANPTISFSGTGQGRVPAECGPAGTMRICSVTAPDDGKLWLRLTGPVGTKTSLTWQEQK